MQTPADYLKEANIARLAAQGARLRELLISAGHYAGFEPRVKLESNESQRIRRLVEREMGVAILPRSDAEGPGAGVVVASLTDPSLTRDITLAWRDGRRHAPAAAEFLELARNTFTDAEPSPTRGSRGVEGHPGRSRSARPRGDRIP